MGYPASINRDLPAALDAHGVENFMLVYDYHVAGPAPQWKLFDLGGPSYGNTLVALSSGWGYWIFVTADADWLVDFD